MSTRELAFLTCFLRFFNPICGRTVPLSGTLLLRLPSQAYRPPSFIELEIGGLRLGVEVMPLDGEQLNDLLSGFVDGELTQEERALVEEAARGDARLGEQLKQLRQQSSWVQQAGNAIANDLSAFSKRLPSVPSLFELAYRPDHEQYLFVRTKDEDNHKFL